MLSDAASRQHYIEGGRRDWDAFFEACGDDPLIEEVARLLRPARPDPADRPAHRPAAPGPAPDPGLAASATGCAGTCSSCATSGDYSAARDFKRRSVAELRAYGFDLRLAFEDDRRNLEMFRAEGVPVRLHPLRLLRLELDG